MLSISKVALVVVARHVNDFIDLIHLHGADFISMVHERTGLTAFLICLFGSFGPFFSSLFNNYREFLHGVDLFCFQGED